ncbi:ABC transporter substrate-binding protein [Agreia pratensis]|uniref:Carbohydrate ABC transporter substrate-binding protein, CUT1 family n=1 Tax=Agreia pratensis TaxID=150121 RepID=A0A1X7I1R8_9MICO|nr:extracellular solute-binding protein [Agreia pratensis]SMG07939.1 carbohydrate ABC transporter substrate-binding protein, CUT1 family [Agreia pratensis]
MHIKNSKRIVALGVLAAISLTGCAAGGSSGSGGGSDAAACAPSDGKVDLTYTSWIPGIDKVVDIWNKENPDIQVKVQTGPNGNGGTYKNFFNQLSAGNAPDLGQIEYDALPNFRVQDGLTNIASCKNVTESKDDFIDWTWNQVTFGEKDSVYAIPQDTGPMAMYYRKDLFEKAGIPVPTTWDEYAAAAKTIRSQGGYITNFPQNDVNWFAGLVWQADGRWFSNDGDKWDVTLTSPESEKVADYWQGLISTDLVSKVPAWTDEWNNAYNTGSDWTWISAVWGANSISSGAPDTSGNWAVAPMPQWKAGENKAGNWGGSSTAVLKGSKHPYEAAQFALWLNTSDEALTALNKEANLYPATKAGLKLPVLSEGVDFYGGQKIYDTFATAATETNSDFVWGPTMTQTYGDVADGFGEVLGGTGTLTDALKTGQKKTIDALDAAAIPVNK